MMLCAWAVAEVAPDDLIRQRIFDNVLYMSDAPTISPGDLIRRYRGLEAEHFGSVFRALAGLCDFTDRDLASRTGWSRQYCNAKKNGAKPIRIEEVARLARALGVPEQVFYEEDVAEAIREAVKYVEWDESAGALRGVYETGQYSPTGRIRECAPAAA